MLCGFSAHLFDEESSMRATRMAIECNLTLRPPTCRSAKQACRGMGLVHAVATALHCLLFAAGVACFVWMECCDLMMS